MSGGKGWKWRMPAIGTPAYHVMLSAVAILVLGPLGGISAAFMNFSIGFYVGGQVLAGILGSLVTLPYGPEGRHGANYMQTMAASVAGMGAMAVLVQAMVWLGLPEPASWKLIAYFLCVGMYGVGIGMLYTPILVDRMQLAFPSGFAVANILRALTDRNLLRRSIAKLGGGAALGYVVGVGSLRLAAMEATGVSASTFGAGMIVGARIALPALFVGLVGLWQRPRLIAIGWLAPDAPFRKIGFIIALGAILGAALLDLALILAEAVRRFRNPPEAPADSGGRRMNPLGLAAWIAGWGAGIVLIGTQVLHQPAFFLIVALLLCLVFVLVNGISTGISDWNPISTAFIMTVFILAALGLKDPGVGLMSASILLIACAEGGDMQQDRSTGWRLGTDRVNQFRYQVIGIATGAVLSVALAKIFLRAYPILRADQFSHPHLPGAQHWQSAMTYKLVGAVRGITTAQPHIISALELGVGLGLAIAIARRLVRGAAAYRRFAASGRVGRAVDFLLDSTILGSPYASAFGAFVELPTLLWWSGGGILGSVMAGRRRSGADSLPEDMGTASLLGGGLIAGDSLAALSVGIYGLFQSVL